MPQSHIDIQAPTGLAEALGTFLFVLVAAGAVCVDAPADHELGRLGVALAAGFALAAVLYAFGRNDAAHLNPAVTLAAVVLARITPARAVRQLAAQLAGAALAGIALRFCLPGALTNHGLGLPRLSEGLSWGRAIAAEGAVGFAWVLAVAKTSWASATSRVGPATVGLVYATAILLVGPLTGAAGSPMRAFGPAFASGTYANHAIYWIGPLAGGVLAAVVAMVLERPRRAAPTPLRGDPREDATVAYHRGVALLQDGMLEEAAQQLATATDLRPDWPEPYYYIGMVYRELGDDANANAFFDAALHFRAEGMHREQWRRDRR